jgi:hypothetical protein
MVNTFNPILQARELKSFTLSNPMPAPAPGRAIVLGAKDQPPLVIRHGDGNAPSFGQYWLGKYKWFYEVDVGARQLTFEEVLYSKENITAFRASITLTCAVSDPAIIVENRVNDVTAVLRPRIHKALADIAVAYKLEQLDQLKIAVNRGGFAHAAPAGLSLGSFICNLSLTRDAEKIAQARVTQELEQKKNLEQAQLDHKLKFEQAQLDHKLKFEQAQLEQKLTSEQLQYEHSRKDEQSQRMEEIIRRGPEAMLAEYLANGADEKILHVADWLANQKWQERKMLLEVDNIRNPEVKKALIEGVTGKPLAQLMSGAPSASEPAAPPAGEPSAQIEVEPASDDDEDDLPEQFR